MKTLKIYSLGNEYVFRDELLLHAVFQILKDFVEEENPQILQWNRSEESARI